MSDTTILVVEEPEITVVVAEEPTTLVVVSAPGPQGPPGPSGSAVVHEQNSASPIWTIDHGLGYVPSWFVKESTGDELEPQRTDPSPNRTIFDFDGAAVSGIAYGS